MIDYTKVVDSVLKNCRPLEAELIKGLQENNDEAIIKELKLYQNKDKGFGNALEPDLRCMKSSALATEQAILILEDLNEKPKELIADILAYLEASYDFVDKKWHIIPKEADAHPRAIWWEYEKIDGFGRFNPSATFVGFLMKYAEDTNIDLKMHLTEIIDYINKTPLDEIDDHELYCFIRLKTFLPREVQLRFEHRLYEIMGHKMEKDAQKWKDYVIEPIKLINSRQHPLYEQHKIIVDQNVDYTILSLEKDHLWHVKHEWYRFEDIFENLAKKEWHGIVTYHNLKVLKNFDKIKWSINE